MTVQVIDYQPEHQPYFEQLNRSWIEKYFWMEPVDVAVLQHPQEYILAHGGHILMAEYNREIVGTVALKFVNENTFEFTKMAVDEKYRGLKVGELLAKAAITWCAERNVTDVILYSNTILAPAISLYRKLGFVEIPLDGPYKRSNIKMQLILKEYERETVV